MASRLLEAEAMSLSVATARPSRDTFGRYVLHAPIGRGGIATVHLARLVGAEGFRRVVAAKKLKQPYASDPDFTTMFLDEARVASKIQHPNVVPVLDVVTGDGELVVVQEYVHGVPLNHLVAAVQRAGERVPIGVAVAIVADLLRGLHGAHEAKDELGAPLGIVHRDVSPQNLIVGANGIARVLDFGIAKARSSSFVTQVGVLKGKLGYMAPEQLLHEPVGPATDVFAAGVVLWELLAGRRLRPMADVPTIDEAPPLDDPALAPIARRALALAPGDRYASAAEMAEALVAAAAPAPIAEVAAWVRKMGSAYLEERERLLADTEGSWRAPLLRVAPASTPTVAEPKRRATLVLLALVLACGLGALALFARRPAPPLAPTVPVPVEVAPVIPDPAPAVVVDAPPATPKPNVVPHVHRAPAPPRATPAPPSAAPSSVVDCTTPYFFEGPKKIFKPECI